MRRWLIELAKGETVDQICPASYASCRAQDYRGSNPSIDAQQITAMQKRSDPEHCSRAVARKPLLNPASKSPAIGGPSLRPTRRSIELLE
jgi:hypothetical protein